MKDRGNTYIRLDKSDGVFWWRAGAENMRYHQTLVNPGRFWYNHTIMVF